MPLVAVSITKTQPFQGVGERFSNVYVYDLPAVDADTALTVIGALADAEKAIHADIVAFEEARAWSVGGSPAENETIVISDLSGVGFQATDPNMYRECCWVVSWKTQRPSVLDKPVWLRKYLHTSTQYTGTPVEDVTNGQAVLPETQRTQLTNYMEAVRILVTPAGEFQLTAPSGRVAANPGVLSPYLQHHEYRY